MRCSRVMMRNVLIQSAYQLGITLWLVYAGLDTFGITEEYLLSNGYGLDKTNEYLGTFIFNTFVLCQVRDRGCCLLSLAVTCCYLLSPAGMC